MQLIFPHLLSLLKTTCDSRVRKEHQDMKILLINNKINIPKTTQTYSDFLTSCLKSTLQSNTVKPLYSGHSSDFSKASTMERFFRKKTAVFQISEEC